MTIKNILVSFNGQPSSAAALAVALKMAEKYGAHLTGFLSHGPSRMSIALGPWVTPDLLTSIRETEAAARETIAKAFHNAVLAAEKSRPGKHHWFDLGGDADNSLMQAARFYDIVVMGQYDSDAETSHLAPHPDTIALRSGRPVLIVPNGFEPSGMNAHAVLAWDGGRAAASAMSDAMPMMETKSIVTVLTVGENQASRRREGMDVVAHLARHGVMTDWKNVPRNGGSIASVIIDMVAQKDAGLLIMGAYEHSSFAEGLIGGVTKDVLKRCPVPVLMSH
ncbi:MAG: nucleotide-binding universal stress UspA family protein [Paracoccaceae bacterium]|jgi:nucleotide-binding universal stress UspA family protein